MNFPDTSELVLDCPRSSRQTPTSNQSALNRFGTGAAQMAVAASSIVKNLDVVKDISPSEVTLHSGSMAKDRVGFFSKSLSSSR